MTEKQTKAAEELLQVKESEGGFGSQLVATLRKNFTQKVRQPVNCCIETLLPVIFVIGMVLIWVAVGGTKDEGAADFVDYSETNADNLGKYLRENLCANRYPSHIPTLLSCSNVTFQYDCLGKDRGLPVDDFCHVKNNIWDLLETALQNFTNLRKVPELDDIVLVRWALRAYVKDQNIEYLEPLKALISMGDDIHFSPRSPQLDSLIAYFRTRSQLFEYLGDGSNFTSNEQAEGHVMNSDTLGTNWAMVQLDYGTPERFDINFRFNRSSLMWTDRMFSRTFQGGEGQAEGTEPWKLQFVSGFLSMQAIATDWYTTTVLNQTLPSEPALAMFSHPKWTDYIFLVVGAQQGYFQLFMVLAYLYPVSQITKTLVQEKELRVREAMMIMGLGDGSFYFSWFLTYAAEILFASILNMIITKATFYPRSDAGIIFFLFFLFGLSCITLSSLISTIFSKSRAAALVSPVVFFLLTIPNFLIANAAPGVKGLLTLLSPSAMAIGMTNMADHEISGGMGPKELASGDDDVNMLAVLFMLGIDTILYGLLTLYLDAVFPAEWGTKRHPLFCIVEPYRWIMRKAHAGEDDDDELEDHRDPNGVYEELGASGVQGPAAVQLRGLRKTFVRGTEIDPETKKERPAEFTAVDNLCLSLRENEVTVLLGHNGAGKTTTINMMTGMLPIDGGDCTVYGNSVRNDLRKVRNDIGFCPQHNILWPELTCAEHLRFYATVKGRTGDDREAAIDEVLRDVDLLDKRDELAGSLSGGQKRKLSVAIAFVGGCRLVFLDEPTAGMDVHARRFTWDLIKRQSANRCILLTTHFMDEADLLGHQIHIMSKGRLKCSGSSMFLKSRLGVGYSVTLAVDPTQTHEAARNCITRHIDDAEPLTSGAAEVMYRIPMHNSGKLPAMMKELEDSGPTMGIDGFGITITTLEEIFFRISEHEELALNEGATNAVAATAGTGGSLQGEQEMRALSSPERHAVVEAKAEKKHIWTQDENQETTSDGKTRAKLNHSMQFTSLFMKRFHNSKRDRRTQCLQVLMPVVCILLALLLTLVEFVQDSPKTYLNSDMYRKHAVDFSLVPTTNCAFNASQYRPSVIPEAMPVNDAREFSLGLQARWMNHTEKRYIGVFCDDPRIGPAMFNDTTGKVYSALFFNQSGYHTPGEVLHFYKSSDARTRAANAGQNPPEMHIAIENMPWTDREQALIENIKTFMIGLVIMIPFTFIPSTFVSWIVKEKECKAKHLQFTSGMNYYVYWFSNLAFDMISFLVTEFLAIIIFLIFQRDEYVGGGEEFGATFLLLLFFGLSSIAMSYAWGFFFDNHATAQNIVMLANFICGFVLVILVFMLELFDSTKDASKTMRWICRLVPAYCLGEGVINLAALGFARAFGVDRSPLDMDTTGYAILYMALEFPVFFFAALMLDHPNRQKRQQQLFHKPDELPPEIEGEDEDVLRERERIEAPGTTSPHSDPAGDDHHPSRSGLDDLVVVRNLCKVYGNGKRAVKNLSYGVKKGEVFGFLGTNGAGKTTTISILCGEQLPTHGRAYIHNFDVVDEALDAQRHVGYCPQFDALLDLLTPLEHLKLYAGLRGIPADRADDVIATLVEVCGLTDHVNTLAMNLSGGNKRKLSVAISLVGGPMVVFLDEPSAGMDPMARRGLWEVINDISSHCSVVLTTHHLEEVEALAHRVAIMVDGQLMCVGDKTHLKSKFGSGFEMSIRVREEEDCSPLKEFIQNYIPAAVLSEERGLKFNYDLPATTKLSEVFGLLETQKEPLRISDYAVSQTSIESVFLRISQEAELRADEESPKAEVDAVEPKSPAPITPMNPVRSQFA